MAEMKKNDQDCDDVETVIEQPGDAAVVAYQGSDHSEGIVIVEVEFITVGDTSRDITPKNRAGWTRVVRRRISMVGSLVVLTLLLAAAGTIALTWPNTPSTLPPTPSTGMATATAFVLPPNSAAWSDTARRVLLIYPTAWKKPVPGDSMVSLIARDGTTLLLYDTNFNRSAVDGIAAVQHAHAAETVNDYDPDLATRDYSDGSVSDIRIGGEPANEMSYTSVSKLMPTQPARRGEILTVTHDGSQYTIHIEYGSDSANADVAAIIASIRFIEATPLPA